MNVTLQDIMGLGLRCPYTRDFVADLWGNNAHLTLCQICELNLPAEELIWIVNRLMPRRDARLFGADCAERVLHLFERAHPHDQRPRASIEAARRHANGKIPDEALEVALEAAKEAAWGATSNSTWGAATEAALSASDASMGIFSDAAGNADIAARDAARDAAWKAAGVAARATAKAIDPDAAWDAAGESALRAEGVTEQKEQLAILKKYCEKIEKTERQNNDNKNKNNSRNVLW